MTPAIDDSLIASLGIVMDDAERESFRKHVQDELDERVGGAVTELLDDDQVAELLQLVNGSDPAALTRWLEANVPEYADVVQDEFDILIGELAENAPKL